MSNICTSFIFMLIFSSTIIFSQDSLLQKSGYRTPEEIESIYASDIANRNRSGCDWAAIEYSYLGDMPNTLRLSDFFYSENGKKIDSAYYYLNNLKSVSAFDYIVANCKNEQVVMINEAHNAPYHRVFVGDLLSDLYEAGFRYFGVEALSPHKEEDELLNTIKFPTINSGLYLKEPQFGNLVRQALYLGFKVFSYESSDKDREMGQAQNIKRILDEDPKAKIIIHAGSGHIREDSSKYGKLMAGYFKDISGINPFTINQVRLTEQYDSTHEHPLYGILSKKKFPVVYVNDINGKAIEDGITDIAIFHPRTNYFNSRPSWIYKNQRYKKIKLKNIYSINEPYLVLAYLKDEHESGYQAIPVDILWVDNATKRHHVLLLPFNGTYKIIFETTNRIYSKEIEI